MEILSKEDDRDIYENSFYFFIKKLEVLAASPQKSCELLGHFNVAFETKFDLEGSDYLFNYMSCNLTKEQKSAVLDLLDSLKHIPACILEYTEKPSVSLINMEHPCWIPLRRKAQVLLKLLEPNIEKNHSYFYGSDNHV